MTAPNYKVYGDVVRMDNQRILALLSRGQDINPAIFTNFTSTWAKF